MHISKTIMLVNTKKSLKCSQNKTVITVQLKILIMFVSGTPTYIHFIHIYQSNHLPSACGSFDKNKSPIWTLAVISIYEAAMIEQTKSAYKENKVLAFFRSDCRIKLRTVGKASDQSQEHLMSCTFKCFLCFQHTWSSQSVLTGLKRNPQDRKAGNQDQG